MYLIEERKCSPECPGRWGRSPLHSACQKNGNLAVVKYLVEKHGCDLHYNDRYGCTPLDLVTTGNNKAVIAYVKESFGMDFTEPSIFVSFIMNMCLHSL